MQSPDLGRNDPPVGDLPPHLVQDMDRDQLSRLVREVNADGQGVSYQKMADRAVDPKTKETLSKAYFQKMATNAVHTPPDEAKLRAIAIALGKPLRVVQRAAAAQFLGFQSTELAGYDHETRIIVAHLAGLPEKERRRWRRMIEAAETDPDQDE